MRQYVGAGWYVWHRTERTIELRKTDPVYWRLTGADGFVRHRIEPGLVDTDALIDGAIKKAIELDEQVSYRVAEQLIPKASAVQAYRMRAHRYRKAFGTPEDESMIGRKRV